MTQPVSGQNLKLPGREKDNLCENTYWHLSPSGNSPPLVLVVDQSQSVRSELDQSSPLPSLE